MRNITEGKENCVTETEHTQPIKSVMDTLMKGCCLCGDESHETPNCPVVSVGQKVKDQPILSHARQTLPNLLSISYYSDVKSVITAKMKIHRNTIFGPLNAPVVQWRENIKYMVFFGNNQVQSLDVSDENECNWMCLVDIANFCEPNNLVAYQLNNKIYFISIKEIDKGEELKVSYSATYHRQIEMLKKFQLQLRKGKNSNTSSLPRSSTSIKISKEMESSNVTKGVNNRKRNASKIALTSTLNHKQNKVPKIPNNEARKFLTNMKLMLPVICLKKLEDDFAATKGKTIFNVYGSNAVMVLKPNTSESVNDKNIQARENPVQISKVDANVSKSSQVEGRILKSSPVELRILKSSPVEGRILKSSPVEGRILKSSPVEGRILKSSQVEGRILKSSQVEGRILKFSQVEGRVPKSSPVCKASTLASLKPKPDALTSDTSVNIEKISEDKDSLPDDIIVCEANIAANSNSDSGKILEQACDKNAKNFKVVNIFNSNTLIPQLENNIEVLEEDLNEETKVSGQVVQLMRNHWNSPLDEILKPSGSQNEKKGNTTINTNIVNKKKANIVKLTISKGLTNEINSRREKVEVARGMSVVKFPRSNAVIIMERGAMNSNFDKELNNLNSIIPRFDSSVKEKPADKLKEKDEEIQSKELVLEKTTNKSGKKYDKFKIDQNIINAKKILQNYGPKALAVTLEKEEWVCSRCDAKLDDCVDLTFHLINEHLKASYKRKMPVKIQCINDSAGGNVKLEAGESQIDNSQNSVAKEIIDYEPYNERKHDNEIYICDLCGKSNRGREYTLRHVKKHTGMNFCHVCKKTFNSKVTLKLHEPVHNDKRTGLKVDPTGEIFYCPICDKPFGNKISLNRHVYMHNRKARPRCKECGKILRKDHICKDKKVKPSIDEMHECKICRKKFTRSITLQKHLPIHTGEFSCQFCGKWLQSKSSLLVHISICVNRNVKSNNDNSVETLDENGTATCSYCQEVFTDLVLFRQHYYIHMNPFECQICGNRFKENIRLTQHECLIREFRCKVCSLVFATYFQMKEHKLLENHVDPPMISESELAPFKTQSFECSFCFKRFVTLQKLKCHSIIHREKKFKCRYCGKKILRKMDLKEHESIHEAPKRTCPYCPRLFKSGKTLMAHIKWHEGIRKFGCKLCSKKFSQKGNLDKHMDVHDKDKRYYCAYCPVNYSSKDSIRLHELTHTQGKQFPCEICGSAFVKSHFLKKHIRDIHSSTSYLCKYCGRNMKLRHSLVRHLKKVHLKREQEWRNEGVITSMKVEHSKKPNKIKKRSKNALSDEEDSNISDANFNSNISEGPNTDSESNESGDQLKVVENSQQLMEAAKNLTTFSEIFQNDVLDQAMNCITCDDTTPMIIESEPHTWPETNVLHADQEEMEANHSVEIYTEEDGNVYTATDFSTGEVLIIPQSQMHEQVLEEQIITENIDNMYLVNENDNQNIVIYVTTNEET